MQVQAVRKDGHYYIPYLEEVGVTVDTITVEIDDNVIPKRGSGYTDEYIEMHWREFAFTSAGLFYNVNDADGNADDDYLKKEYGRYLNEKNNF